VTPREWLSALRHGPDRLLHPSRRRAALDLLQRAPRPTAIVVSCLGNICRSPYAEAVLRGHFGGRHLSIPLSSAGLIGPGRPADPTARERARARGVFLDEHRSRLIAPVPAGAILLLMDPGHRPRVEPVLHRESVVIVLGDLDPHPITTRVIPDPYGRTPEEFDRAFDRIDRCLEVLLGTLR